MQMATASRAVREYVETIWDADRVIVHRNGIIDVHTSGLKGFPGTWTPMWLSAGNIDQVRREMKENAKHELDEERKLKASLAGAAIYLPWAVLK